MMTCGCETRALKKFDKKGIVVAEIKLLRRTAGVTLRDWASPESITLELGGTPIMKKKSSSAEKNWRKHVERMEERRSPEQVLHHTPIGRRSKGRPKKKLINTSGSSLRNSTLQQRGQIA